MVETDSDQAVSGQAEGQDAAPAADRFGRDIALYTVARFGLVAVVAAVLSLFGVPLLIAVVVGLIAGLPLSMVLLRPWHNRVMTSLAARTANRQARRARLRAQLRGETASDPDDE